MSALSIVFAGTPEFGIPCLEALAASQHQLTAVYSQPDRPAGRGRQLQASAVKSWALKHNIPVYQPLNFKSEAAIAELTALKPDVLVVIAYGLILPRAVLAIPRLGCINVHASLLPRWRGASPIQQAILHGDAQSGVTIMQMDVGMDTGDMLATVSCPIGPQMTAGMLHDVLATISASPLVQTLDALALGTVSPEVQDNNFVTYAPKINKEDALLNWQRSAQELDQQIRAYNPWPIAYAQIGDQTMRVFEARPLEQQSNHAPGTIIALDKYGLLVATGSGSLLIERIQFPGSKAMAIAEWLNARRSTLSVGMCLQ